MKSHHTSNEAERKEETPPPHEVYTALLAHELRTPVTSIFGYLQLLSDDQLLSDPDRLRQYLAVVRGRAADLARIVSELTTFTELVTGAAPTAPARQPTTLTELLANLGQGRNVRIQLTGDAGAATVDVDRVQLVLQQLVDNAVKFGAPGAEVLVRGELTGQSGRVVIRVTNLGEPIPADKRADIFAPYRQADSDDARRHGGLGLGLTVARRAAESDGGSLVLEPGEPTTFRLEVPVREDTVAREARALREQAILKDAQALRAVEDMRSMRVAAQRERTARELAEAQQLRAVEDFRSAHRKALALADRLDTAYLETISAMARAVEARDNYTGGHVERVRIFSRRIGVVRGLTPSSLRQLEFGAVLHDVGKIGIPDSILHKTGRLDPDEWTFMRRHPEIGRRVLEGVSFLAEALDAVGCHHERWDGTGYPAGLAGDAIPLFGRIVAVADAFDAMVTDRPYRSGLPVDVALAQIERGRGAQFDPDIAQALLADPPDEQQQMVVRPS